MEEKGARGEVIGHVGKEESGVGILFVCLKKKQEVGDDYWVRRDVEVRSW